MQTLTVGDFKAHFSDVLKDVKNGEEFLISYGRKKERVAVLVPFEKYKKKNTRKLGLLKDLAKCEFHKDFKISDEEFLRL